MFTYENVKMSPPFEILFLSQSTLFTDSNETTEGKKKVSHDGKKRWKV